jgi:hypothetical protein
MREIASPQTLPDTRTALGGYPLVLVITFVIGFVLKGWKQDPAAFLRGTGPEIFMSCLRMR